MSRSTASFAAVALAVTASTAFAEDKQLPCRPNLVPCNYSDYFSGTIGWRSDFKSPSEQTHDALDVSVVDGKAACSGTLGGQPIKGPGLLSIEYGRSHEDTGGQPWYEITVSCPQPEGRPADLSSPSIQTYKQKDTTGFKTLAGKIEQENPDADPDNGVTGTESISWSLTRKGDLKP